MFLVQNCWEHEPKELRSKIGSRVRGIYALLNHVPAKGKVSEKYNVVYVGLARGAKAGICRRLNSHAKSKRKGKKWTHFSAFKVWENIPEQFVEELEGILREIYRHDSAANLLNMQKKYRPLQRVRERLEKKPRSSRAKPKQ